MDKVDYSEIFNSGGITALDSNATEFYIELTMNHPRCKGWDNLISTRQFNLYLKKLNDIKNCLGFNNLGIVDYGFEVSKDGHFHCHALLHSTCAKVHFPLGVVSDIVKTYLSSLPKKYQKYYNSNMYDKYRRYHGPGICVQYQDSSNKERIKEWLNYINKYK